MEVAISARGLVKNYREGGLLRRRTEVRALDGLSFEVGYGKVFALLGPNGAGKTTTVRIISTLLLPDEGEVTVAGFNALRSPRKVRERIGVVLDPDKGHFLRLTALENLTFYGTLQGLSRSEARSRASALLGEMGLNGSENRMVEGFSKGMRARLAICRALIHDPEVLIFDEPTSGLDPISAREVRAKLRELGREGKSVLVTTHNLWEAESVSDEVAVVNRGKVVAAGPPQEVKRAFGLKWYVELEVEGRLRPEELPWMAEVAVSERGILTLKIAVDADPAELIPAIVSELRSRSLTVHSVTVREPTLEEAFVRAVSGAGR
ncbi:MAG: ABC transporter ATP-binding protein [Thaumarchaeota archaeon]|nr:ABC transporter ATP-binding protein [Candidatus Calditenuaceae archaeon]MDW8041945.1 ABC transporter ATP-binding protein [Nitrososphaerota archaeon]